MKINFAFKALSIAVALPVLLTSCGDDYEYTPGQEVTADCPGVYFPNDNETKYILSGEDLGDDWSLNVTVGRKKAVGALDVPLEVVTADEAFSFPASIHFNDGEEETTVNVKFPGLAQFEDKKFTIRVPYEYVDLYSQDIEGTGAYSASVLVSEWRKIVKDVEAYVEDQSSYYFDLYWLAGANQFRFGNFLESGLTLTFKIVDNPTFDIDNVDTWYGHVYPLDNYLVREETDTDLYWYLYDDEKQERPRWTTESYGWEMKGNICFHTKDSDINFVKDIYYADERVELWKINSTSQYFEMYWNPADVNLDGYKD